MAKDIKTQVEQAFSNVKENKNKYWALMLFNTELELGISNSPGKWATNTIRPFRAYFTTTSGASALTLDFGDVTAITNTNRTNDTNNGEVYNLAGQRVAQPTKGLYIVNGKKAVIK